MLLENKRDEIATFPDDVTDIPLNFRGVEIVHCLYCIDILIDHSYDILEIVGSEDALLKFRPHSLNNICFEIRPKTVYGQIHFPSSGAQLPFKYLAFT